jgi:hypothetical protein
MRKNTKVFILLFVVIAGVAVVLFYHEVDNSITAEDKIYIIKYLKNEYMSDVQKKRSYEQELELITRVQKAVLKIARGRFPIPFNSEREPKDLYVSKTGLCYDKSRVIEKILKYLGFETRHISIFSIHKTGSGLKSLLTPQVRSHAVSEVLTSRGWLVVESNSVWIALDKKKEPVSIREMHTDEGKCTTVWRNNKMSDIYKNQFIFVYGLYSRHGRFYPPYNFIPDVNYKELMQSFRLYLMPRSGDIW